MTVTIGRIVHFIERAGAEPLPAIVVKVWSDTCINLHIFPDVPCKSPHLVTSVVNFEGAEPRWMWPPRAAALHSPDATPPAWQPPPPQTHEAPADAPADAPEAVELPKD